MTRHGSRQRWAIFAGVCVCVSLQQLAIACSRVGSNFPFQRRGTLGWLIFWGAASCYSWQLALIHLLRMGLALRGLIEGLRLFFFGGCALGSLPLSIRFVWVWPCVASLKACVCFFLGGCALVWIFARFAQACVWEAFARAFLGLALLCVRFLRSWRPRRPGQKPTWQWCNSSHRYFLEGAAGRPEQPQEEGWRDLPPWPLPRLSYT